MWSPPIPVRYNGHASSGSRSNPSAERCNRPRHETPQFGQKQAAVLVPTARSTRVFASPEGAMVAKSHPKWATATHTNAHRGRAELNNRFAKLVACPTLSLMLLCRLPVKIASM